MSILSKITRFGDGGLLIMRLAIGSVFLAHGIMKWSMWGMEPSETLRASMLTVLKILSVVEPILAIGLILGFLTPLVALGLGVVMLGAINLKMRILGIHFIESNIGGWEYEFVMIAVLIGLVLIGPGKYSVDGRKQTA